MQVLQEVKKAPRVSLKEILHFQAPLQDSPCVLQVIAVVTDSLTDVDIFRDLQEACTQRRVPVYILLDRACVPAFLQMCGHLDIRLDALQVLVRPPLCCYRPYEAQYFA